MSKWNRWTLINKNTGLTFKQYYKAGHMGTLIKDEKLIPVLLDSGVPAYYHDTAYYPSLTILNSSEWIVKMRPT